MIEQLALLRFVACENENVLPERRHAVDERRDFTKDTVLRVIGDEPPASGDHDLDLTIGLRGPLVPWPNVTTIRKSMPDAAAAGGKP